MDSIVVVACEGMSLGIMSFALGVFDMALSYGELPGTELRAFYRDYR